MEEEIGLHSVRFLNRIQYYFADQDDDYEYFKKVCAKGIKKKYQYDLNLGYPSFDEEIQVFEFQYRDKNVGQETLVYLSQFKLPLEIHINALNLDTIEAFKHLGFVEKGLINDDIGNGYINKDVILRKE
jgi:hypothetical protein